MHAMLAQEGRRVEFAANIRRTSDENGLGYEGRVAESFARSGARIAWLCLAPGEHVPPLVRAVIAAGLHVIVEKPWIHSREETGALIEAADKAKVSTAVNFEYCWLSEIESWRRVFHKRRDLKFGGVFTVRAENHLGIPATENLGCHLVAIQIYAVPDAGVSGISCAYDSEDERKVWIESGEERLGEINFWGSKEPIIQRFLSEFEKSLDGERFPFDLGFGLKVAEKIRELRTGPKTPDANTDSGAP